MTVCKQHNIPVYLERSRSGNGGHVWVFSNRHILPGKAEKLLFIYYEKRVFCQNLKKMPVLTGCFSVKTIIRGYLKERFETITISGDDSKGSQQSKMKQIRAGHFQIVLSTGQFFGEGIDVDQFNCLFLAYPFAFKGKLIQYIGRITRSNQIPIIYDYRDLYIKYFEKLFKKRNRFYDEIRKANQITMDL